MHGRDEHSVHISFYSSILQCSWSKFGIHLFLEFISIITCAYTYKQVIAIESNEKLHVTMSPLYVPDVKEIVRNQGFLCFSC